MRQIRVITGGVVFCLFACGIALDSGAAQVATAEPVGQPMQLLQLAKYRKADVKPHAKLAARPAAKTAGSKGFGRSAAKSASKMSRSETPGSKMSGSKISSSKISGSKISSSKTRIALRRRARPHIMAAEQKPQQWQSQLAAAPQVAAPPPAPADNAWPAAPSAMSVDATTLAPTPQIVPPVAAPAPSALIVDGQIVQVASADEANAIDLAANDASVVADDGSLSATTASHAATTDNAQAAVKADPAGVTVSAAQKADVGSTSWLLQVMAALGGAVAAGSAAWFLIGSAPQRAWASPDEMLSELANGE
jgi:hypothetical protein